MAETLAPVASADSGPATPPVPATPDYDPRLTNDDLAPLREQKWGSYNIFAFWMSDVHSVGANSPAIIRGLIAVAWYGIQTFLASTGTSSPASGIPAWTPPANWRRDR